MKGRAESAERKAESLESQVKELQEKLRQEIAENSKIFFAILKTLDFQHF